MIPLRDPASPADLAALLGDPGDDADWMDSALCAQTDPDEFFPDKGGSPRDAKRICAACEVRADCLEYALAHNILFGVWGGLTPDERRRLARARTGAALAALLDDLADNDTPEAAA